MVSAKSLENLKLSPHTGRSPGSISLVSRAKQYLQEHPEKLDEIINSLILGASKGKIDCIKELKVWLDGLPTTKVEVRQIEPIIVSTDSSTITIQQNIEQ